MISDPPKLMGKWKIKWKFSNPVMILFTKNLFFP